MARRENCVRSLQQYFNYSGENHKFTFKCVCSIARWKSTSAHYTNTKNPNGQMNVILRSRPRVRTVCCICLHLHMHSNALLCCLLSFRQYLSTITQNSNLFIIHIVWKLSARWCFVFKAEMSKKLVEMSIKTIRLYE